MNQTPRFHHLFVLLLGSTRSFEKAALHTHTQPNSKEQQMTRFIARKETYCLALLMTCSFILSGCGGNTVDETKLDTVPVTGTVMLDGASPGECILEFRPVSVGTGEINKPATARVKEDGSFVVGTYGDGDGAPAGKYSVHLLPLDSTSAGPALQAKDAEVDIADQADGVELSIMLESAKGSVDPLLIPPSN
jgi:hypothetical protein